MEEMDNITEQKIEEIVDTKELGNDKEGLSFEEKMAIECVKKIKNPFRMITVDMVMKDLNICRTIAYRLFQRDDFPSINIGKTHQVTLIAYLLWKIKKRV